MICSILSKTLFGLASPLLEFYILGFIALDSITNFGDHLLGKWIPVLGSAHFQIEGISHSCGRKNQKELLGPPYVMHQNCCTYLEEES